MILSDKHLEAIKEAAKNIDYGKITIHAGSGGTLDMALEINYGATRGKAAGLCRRMLESEQPIKRPRKPADALRRVFSTAKTRRTPYRYW